MKQLIFKAITICSLGVFKDSTTVNLETSKKKPVILVEGMNGCGKTTLLQLLQIGLYGEHAYKQSKSAYAKLISGLIRQDSIENPSVALQISLKDGPRHLDLTVRREWKRTPKTFSESFAVFNKGIVVPFQQEQWLDTIDEYLPAELADLFFFDGEKIEQMANPERMPAILKQATEALLGVGGIDSIINDLVAFERRTLLQMKKNSASADNDAQQLQNKLDDLNATDNELDKLVQLHGSLLIRKDELVKDLEETRNKYSQQGLGAYNRSAELKERIKLFEAQLDELKKARLKVVADPLYPLFKLSVLTNNLFNAVEEEKDRADNKKILEAVKQHDSNLALQLKNEIPEFSSKIDYIFKIALDKLITKSNKKTFYQTFDTNVYKSKISALSETSLDINNRINKIQSEILSTQRALAEVPAREKVELLLKNLGIKENSVKKIVQELSQSEEKIITLRSKRIRLNAQVQNLQTEIKKDIGQQERKHYSLEAGVRSRKLFDLYKQKLITNKAKWLSSAIFSYFSALLRKKGFIGQINIDPETFTVAIKDTKDKAVPVERLSAGERQMLATGLLQAIMSAKSAVLPIVVDTPLARLDGAHRLNLVRNFYTKVSQQVLILSTDEEITGRLQEAIAPYISHSYRFTFNESSRATEITEI